MTERRRTEDRGIGHSSKLIKAISAPSLIKAFANCVISNKARNDAMVPREGVEVGLEKGLLV